ncbi:MAG: sulfatase-like hydrolase/transferase [Bacteroidaceae bacterium]|nr:sulfatase-like hydrolase/transferase [Bacteroidaceae bacterium]
MKKNSSSAEFLKAPFPVLVYNLILAYVLFMLCRIIFICYNWTELAGSFNDRDTIVPFIKGALKFDTAGILYLTLPYIVLTLFPFHFKERKGFFVFLRILFTVSLCLAAVANLADTIYFPYTGCRSTFSVFTEFQDESTSEILKIFIDNILGNWYLAIAGAVLIILMCLAVKTPVVVRFNRLWKYYLIRTILLCAGVALSVCGIRGGFATSIRPIAMSTAYQYVSTTSQAAAVLNTPFCAIRSIGHTSTDIPEYFSGQELENIYSPVIEPDSGRVFTPKNVVVFILESFGAEYIGQMNPGRAGIHDCTPFLDSLMERSLYFEYSMANGRKSIDAMPSILSGIPMLNDHFMLTGTMMSKPVGGLAGYLKDKGYHSVFFHGADNESMGFQSYARLIGYDDYYGRYEFNRDSRFNGDRDFDGVWAVWDEEFLQFMADSINEFREPFVASVFTASSHNPFNIPEKYRGTWPDEGGLPIYKTVRYSDNALREFFENASRQPWFENTLFVLTADHTNLSEHPDYQSAFGQFRVPIIFYAPGDSLVGQRHCLAQQSDILPTILGYLGYDKPIVAFGQNLLETPDQDVWAANYQNGIYMFYRNGLMIQFDGNQLLGTYEYEKDTRLENNIKGRYPEIEEAMEAQLKAIVQQYMEHMASKPLVLI